MIPRSDRSTYKPAATTMAIRIANDAVIRLQRLLITFPFVQARSQERCQKDNALGVEILRLWLPRVEGLWEETNVEPALPRMRTAGRWTRGRQRTCMRRPAALDLDQPS